MTIREKLTAIQSELKVGKTKFNKFGNYYYRSLEDIFDAIKPMLSKNGITLTINDEIRSEGEYTFIEAIVRIEDDKDFIETRAFAGIDKTKGKMDLSQIFGSASSYARKYAMNGMFLIDDAQDADSDSHTKMRNEAPKKPIKKETPSISTERLKALKEEIKQAKTIEEITKIKSDNSQFLSVIKNDLKNRYDEIK